MTDFKNYPVFCQSGDCGNLAVWLLVKGMVCFVIAAVLAAGEAAAQLLLG
jgi:hypothetical protein